MKRFALVTMLAALTVLGQTADKKQAPKQETKVVDPVCGMTIDPAKAAGKTVYQGKTYYFCARTEKEAFDKNPEKYAGKKAK